MSPQRLAALRDLLLSAIVALSALVAVALVTAIWATLGHVRFALLVLSLPR